MAQSPEYPDLRWIEPRAWGQGRDGKAVRYIVIHYTAGSEGPTSAEDGALYNQRRTDGVSAHYFVDRNSIVQGVRTRDRANCARHRGNRLGIQYELCGTVQTREQWLDAASKPTLRNAARQCARDCKKYDIPVRRLTVEQTRAAWTQFPNGPRGFVGHVDCTYAYPEDEGSHTDPGREFPWDVFLDMVREEIDKLNGEDDMNAAEMTEWAQSAAGKAALGAALADAKIPAPEGSGDADGVWLLRTYITNIYGKGVNAASTSAQTLALLQSPQTLADSLTASLAGPLAQALIDAMPAGVLTAEEVEQACTEAVRTVLRDGVNP